MALRRGLGGRENLRFGLDGIRNHLTFKHNWHGIANCKATYSGPQLILGIPIIPNGVPRQIEEVFGTLMERYIAFDISVDIVFHVTTCFLQSGSS